MRYQYEKIVKTAVHNSNSSHIALQAGNEKTSHQLGHLLTDGKVIDLKTKQRYLLLSATGTNTSSTSGWSFL